MIDREELAVAEMGRWLPSDLAYVLQLDIHTPTSRSASILMVALFQLRGEGGWPDPAKPMWRVTIRFEGVRGLRLDSFGGGPVQIMGFEITSLADRGLEDLAFQVSDYEDARIAFVCSEIEILSVGKETGEYFP